MYYSTVLKSLGILQQYCSESRMFYRQQVNFKTYTFIFLSIFLFRIRPLWSLITINVRAYRPSRYARHSSPPSPPPPCLATASPLALPSGCRTGPSYTGWLSLPHLYTHWSLAIHQCIWKRRSPVLGSKYSRQLTTCVYWGKDSVHIGRYNASHYWIFYQNKKQMCRMLRILNTFQKNNFRRSWKISHGTWWVTFGFPRLF